MDKTETELLIERHPVLTLVSNLVMELDYDVWKSCVPEFSDDEHHVTIMDLASDLLRDAYDLGIFVVLDGTSASENDWLYENEV